MISLNPLKKVSGVPMGMPQYSFNFSMCDSSSEIIYSALLTRAAQRKGSSSLSLDTGGQPLGMSGALRPASVIKVRSIMALPASPFCFHHISQFSFLRKAPIRPRITNNSRTIRLPLCPLKRASFLSQKGPGPKDQRSGGVL